MIEYSKILPIIYSIKGTWLADDDQHNSLYFYTVNLFLQFFVLLFSVNKAYRFLEHFLTFASTHSYCNKSIESNRNESITSNPSQSNNHSCTMRYSSPTVYSRTYVHSYLTTVLYLIELLSK